MRRQTKEEVRMIGNERKRGLRGRRALLALVCVGALAIVGAGCGDDDDDGGSTTGGGGGGTENVTLTLPYQDSIVWLGYEVARDQFYPELGVNPETQALDGSSLVTQQLIAGQLDYGVTSAAELIIANSQGHELVSFASMDQDIFTIESLPDSDVKSMEDLEGKALGVTDLAGGEIPLVRGALKEAGLVEGEDVELKVVGPGGPAAVRALQDGEIAAYAGATNDFAALQTEGIQTESILSEEFSGLPSDQLAARADALEDPATVELLTKIAAGWFDGALYGQANPEEGLRIACGYAPAECEDQASAKVFFDITLAASVPAAQAAGGHELSKYETIAGTLTEEAPDAESVDLESVFTNEYVDGIREEMTQAK
jgi:NitT/TauT family transport system substrate-binding protein